MSLPNELLDNIITYVLPEGFESLALTCRRIYALCIPFIERHNRLRSQFQKFTYFQRPIDPIFTIRTAFDLITRIAVEPIVARYVRDADFRNDTLLNRGRPRELLADVHCGGAVVRLLADSPYLKQAGLDWEKYYAQIEEELKARHYSQYAAAFLLTLLPNVEKLRLPILWKPVDATDKLIDAVIRKAKQTYFPYNRPSLAQTTRLGPALSRATGHWTDLHWVNPFLALPRIRSFCGSGCVAMDDGYNSIASKDQYWGFANTLEAIYLENCCIDEVSIADFLKRIPNLRTLKYSHSTNRNGGPKYWDICKFVTSIEREAGRHLEKLSLSICDPCGSIVLGDISMHGFQRLRKLELPLEIALCSISAACQVDVCDESLVEGSTDHELDCCESFIGDFVPASISQLSLITGGMEHPEKALDLISRHLAARKDSQLPALKEIFLTLPINASNAYQDQCTTLFEETEKVGVILHFEPWRSLVAMTWDEEQ